ncbi:MAG: methionyl-tRNA formyltransferase [Candidatus Abyssubacteria bacterium]
MNIIFLGTPLFAAPTLKRLAHTRHQILAVLTQPDRPSGRGMALSPPPVKTLALELGFTILQPQKASSPSALTEIRKLSPDAAVVVAYGQLLTREFLEVPRFGCINLHPSLLPRYRGASPIQSAILAGDRMTGVTTMLLDDGMDTGPILLQREVEITDDDTAGTLHDKLAEAGADLMVETLDAVEYNAVIPRPQEESHASVTKKIEKADCRIEWGQPAERIRNLARAMDPWPGCWTTLDRTVLKIWKVEVCDYPKTGAPGRVLSVRDGLVVQAGDGAVRIIELQAPGSRRMTAAEFLRGHVIKEGMLLGSDLEI